MSRWREERRLAARDLADELGLPIGNAVDFWTEASLFSRAGLTAFVYGPGDIAQAHTADEWVALDQLQRYADAIERILAGTPDASRKHVHDPQTRQTIVRLLSSMASAKEISQYLKRFSQLDAARFAVVKVGGAVLRDDLEALTSSLAFLQDVGLTPIVIHGAGPQLDEELAAAGIEKQTVNGLRVTSPEALAIVRRVFHAQNLKLVEALQAQDARATSIVSGVFEAEYLDRDTYGLVGEVKRVDLAPIQASLQAGSIPVIASLGETAGGQILNVNADFAANELVQVLQPYKIVFLTGTGGLLDDDGQGDRFDQPVHRVRTPDRAAVDQRRHAGEDRADQGPARQAAAVLVGVDHAAGRAGQGTVHAQGLGHAGAARRARAAARRVGTNSTCRACAR